MKAQGNTSLLLFLYLPSPTLSIIFFFKFCRQSSQFLDCFHLVALLASRVTDSSSVNVSHFLGGLIVSCQILRILFPNFCNFILEMPSNKPCLFHFPRTPLQASLPLVYSPRCAYHPCPQKPLSQLRIKQRKGVISSRCVPRLFSQSGITAHNLCSGLLQEQRLHVLSAEAAVSLQNHGRPTALHSRKCTQKDKLPDRIAKKKAKHAEKAAVLSGSKEDGPSRRQASESAS